MAMTIGKTDYTAGMQNQYMKNAQATASKALGAIAAERDMKGIDSANLQIADMLRSEINGQKQGIANANDAIGMLQIAEGTLENLNDSTNRMNELAVRAVNGVKLDANGNIDPSEMNSNYQRAINAEATKLKESMQSSIDSASFNGKNVFGGQLNFETTAGTFGINLTAPNLNNLDVRNQQSILDFAQQINKVRSDIGSVQQGLMANINNISNGVVNKSASESQLQNNDIAKNASNLQTANILLNASTMSSAHNLTSLRNQVSNLLA